jgi:hypothetical protein
MHDTPPTSRKEAEDLRREMDRDNQYWSYRVIEAPPDLRFGERVPHESLDADELAFIGVGT